MYLVECVFNVAEQNVDGIPLVCRISETVCVHFEGPLVQLYLGLSAVYGGSSVTSCGTNEQIAQSWHVLVCTQFQVILLHYSLVVDYACFFW